MLGPLFLVVHNHLLCLDHVEEEGVVLAPHSQVSDLLPIGCVIVVGVQAYHCCVVSKLNDGVGVVFGHSVIGEQEVQEGTEDAALRGPSVEDQHGRCVVAYPYHLGVARQEVQDPIAEGGVLYQGLSLVMCLEGTMVLNAFLSRWVRAVWSVIEIVSAVDLLG